MNRLTWLSSWVLVRYFSKGEGGGGGGKLRWKLYHPPVCCWHRFPPLAHVRRATSREFPIWISIGWFLLLLCSVLFPPPTERVGITKIKKEREKRRKKWNCQKLSHSTMVTFHVHERYGANESVDAKSNHQVDAKTYRWCTSLIKYYPAYFRHFRFDVSNEMQ